MVLGLNSNSKKESSYELIKSLGHGSYGEVLLARVVRDVQVHEVRNTLLPCGTHVAVKQIQASITKCVSSDRSVHKGRHK